ncbi:conserved Plasmodium protein, unknown function [Plasmodium malariae]|uniref:Uncharacterized protein n=1 Tax=Plasmodium malariae TaxID=5858 RepID=A0A1C3L2V8_PLAMA|nr:conserved Plasmodium protein, unknown function [Plasmodium malariae]
MTKLATAILYSTYGRNLGNFLFNTFLFFASYLNLVCLMLKKISWLFNVTGYRELYSLYNIKHKCMKEFTKEKKNIQLLNIASIHDLDILNNSIRGTETEINERLSTDIEDFYNDEYNFDFIDMVQDDFDE